VPGHVPMMSARLLMQTLAISAVLVAVAPPADAQRGGARHAPQGTQPSQEQPAPGEYPLEQPGVSEVVTRGEGAQALVYYERTAKEAEQKGDQQHAARAWHAAAIVASRLGHHQRVIQYSSGAIDAFKAAGSVSPRDQMAWADSYLHLGTAYRVVGDLAKSRQAFEDGLQFAKTNLSGLREGQVEGFFLNRLAGIALAQKDYQTALARNTQAAQFFEGWEARSGAQMGERQRSAVRRWVANSLVGIGRDQQALGYLDEADAAFGRALTYARSSALREVEMQALAAQGNLALARKDWAKALDLYQQSIALASQMGPGLNLAPFYQGQSRALQGLGRTAEAFGSIQEAIRQIEQIRADLTDPTLRSGFFEDKLGLYQRAVHLALEAQHPEEAFAIAERSRSRTFLDLLGSQTTLSKGRTRGLVAEEVRLRSRLAEARAEAQQSEGTEEGAGARARAETLDRDYQAFLERVRKENLEQASLMAVEPVTLSEIQTLLPERTTLLEYHLGPEGAVVWVVERQRFKVVQLPGDTQSLRNQIRQFRNVIAKQAPIGTVQTQAQALYDRLVRPARAEINSQRLLIVPHAALHYLPFAALRSPDGRWVAEEFTTSTLPSASVLRYLTDKGAGASDRALVVGNPDLGPDAALPWAEREARLVGQREREATVLLRADATEAQVKKLVESVGLVHFATHGELSESDPLSSAVLLVPGGGEDGRLEVREVFGLDLHARLVVLSACETGLGQLSRGDELVGLQRAFLYAGTPAVMTTLWKVDDRATYELIRALYSRLETSSPAEALRQAQIETMKTFSHPYQWAAFGLSGLER